MGSKVMRRGPNIQEDAQRIWEVLDKDGIVIIPADVGYAICTCNQDKLEQIFHLKGRAAHKRHAILGSMDIHHDLHIMDPQHEEMLRTLVEVYGIPMGTIAKFKTDHPNLQALSEFTLKASTVDDTVDVLVNAGALMTAVTNLAWFKGGKAIFGSSANISTTGMKYTVETIEQPIKDAADLIVDYGLAKYHIFGRASTMIDFVNMKVVRFGACYPTIHYVFKRYFDVELPEDPGLGALRDGHLVIPDAIVRPAHPLVKEGKAVVP